MALDGTATPRLSGSALEQTMSTPLNNTTKFLENTPRIDSSIDFEQLLDENTRELLKFGFKKIAKKNDYIHIAEMGDAFRHAGQNPTADTINNMIEKAKNFKRPNENEENPAEPDDKLYASDFLNIVHEYWQPIEEDKEQLQEAFDILDPDKKNLMKLLMAPVELPKKKLAKTAGKTKKKV
ncbi:unnamed protein product [Didymodactylos carnosus]|uniref:Uncharacterized protein n=1 Tax=Didymodactylos carnosus TaxID=1234261 RepID=A0A815DMT4_9BILA|nr:unnamed protein product [Didymodactylos carnosus]CAF1299917.1 unnamed protein product [Didymodactylos carnosus]CAF4105938.1 unnamed protein product [Didymodactylos carnosus]CAF4121933.1 unnamed protein product [Didymodactylos carnosus]